MITTLALLLAATVADAPIVRIDADNAVITESCRIQIAAPVIEDADDNGVIHITGDDITITFTGPALNGAPTGRAPDAFTGTGVVITGENVTLNNAAVHGYKVGLRAASAHGLTIDTLDVSNNFRQRLKSTRRAEDPSDWLHPHHNDDNQWAHHYGAGLCVEDTNRAVISNVVCRKGQNGIILDRVNNSLIFDNDCSFLSGWGLALWRSSDNTISRNAFDFCVRGYSHGVYHRGQDSAGVLMFEQCCRNVIAENSCTHGGDGLFGFAGLEALGEDGVQRPDTFHHRLGCNDNLFIGNDFSDAPAHGLEMTFSFGNRIIDNRFASNQMSGVWGSYCRDTLISGNAFTRQ